MGEEKFGTILWIEESSKTEWRDEEEGDDEMEDEEQEAIEKESDEEGREEEVEENKEEEEEAGRMISLPMPYHSKQKTHAQHINQAKRNKAEEGKSDGSKTHSEMHVQQHNTR